MPSTKAIDYQQHFVTTLATAAKQFESSADFSNALATAMTH